MERGLFLCAHCRFKPVTPPKRKYCDDCSPLASTIWKRTHRRLWNAQGDSHWRANWKHKTDEERKAYFREYMRKYRQKKKQQLLSLEGGDKSWAKANTEKKGGASGLRPSPSHQTPSFICDGEYKEKR